MKYPENIQELVTLPIDYMGLIFYEKSPRYVSQLDLLDLLNSTHSIERVGVFVNENIEIIRQKAKEYHLSFAQLHGNESPEFCKELSQFVNIIKAFSVADESDLEKTKDYENLCSYFLFDTKTSQYGGSGQKFDWTALDAYEGSTPFLLSGGISVNDVEAIRAIKHPRFEGVDLNSCFETQPGLKNINLLKQFITDIQS